MLTLEIVILDDPEPCAIERALHGDPLRTFVRTVSGELWHVRYDRLHTTHYAVVPSSGQADSWPMRRREIAVQQLSHAAARLHPEIARLLLPWRMSLELWEAGKFAHVGVPWPALP